MSHQTHPYHLVNPSPWPAFSAAALFFCTLGGAMLMHQKGGGAFLLAIGAAMVLYVMYVWWRDVVHEARVDHAHTPAVTRGLRAGMALFITSEVMFFTAFFWAFFSSSTLPRLPLADVWAIAPGVWPPKGIHPFDPFHLPFLNTLILLLSGTTVTWAHYAILQGNKADTVKALWFTVLLGITFTCCQAYEYTHAAFGFTQGIFASTFYMATGFHGFHVIVGTIFLCVCLIRAGRGHFTPEKHLGFECAAWYWHFVDVVWLFLFVFVYCNFANQLMPIFEAVFTGTNMLVLLGLAAVAGVAYGFKVLSKGVPIRAHH